VAEMAHQVAVMYAGQIVERADARSLFARPLHPYTRGLLASLPQLSTPAAGTPSRLTAILGTVPEPGRLPTGCRFAPRCPQALDRCGTPQSLLELRPGQD